MSWLLRKKLLIFFLIIALISVYFLIFHFQWVAKEEKETHFYVSSAYLLENEGENNTVRLIVLAPQDQGESVINCRNQNGSVTKSEIQNLGGPKVCKWSHYFIDCNFNEPTTNLFLFNKDGKETEVSVKRSNPKQHNVVVCFARMFMFENWRVALTSIEMYRAHGADLLSIPIISVIDNLYNILKAYEKAGIAKLTDGVILPKIFDEYDPNKETEFFNQVISNTECLYEYRNSKFVIFADFDDVYVPRYHFNMYEELSKISAQHSLASSFEFLRDPNTKILYAKSPEKFNLDKSVAHIELSDWKSSPGKTVAIPSRLKNGLIHRPVSSDVINGYEHVRMNDTDAYFLHLGGVIEGTVIVNYTTYVNQITYPSLQNSLFDVLQNDLKANESFYNLPITSPFFDAMMQCHVEIATKLNSNQEFCPSALYCQPTAQNENYPTCAKLKAHYSSNEIGQKITIHQPSKTDILTGSNCQI